MAKIQHSLLFGNLARGFTRFQFGIIVAVYGGFLFVLFDRVMDTLARVEENEVTWMRVAVETSMNSEALALLIRGKEAQIPLILGKNPIEFLDRLPRNYLGEFCSLDTKKVTPGNWYFDKCDMKLVYLLKNRKFLADGQSNVLKFKVKFNGLPKNIAKPQGARTRTEGVILERVE
jgi:general secretion pathway protein G